jgi:hypothetical protein
LKEEGPWPSAAAEEVSVSFASEPGRDDGSLPPVNIVIPDDARELDRDVLAYHRERRARRRRERIMRLFGPLRRRGPGGHAAILPLIATCVALSMLAGAMLSVMTISPASAPTVSRPPSPASPASRAPGQASSPRLPAKLPSGTVRVDSKPVQVRSLVSSAVALIPAGCGCGTALRRLAGQSAAAGVGLYFAASGAVMAQLAAMTARYGAGTATAVYDSGNLLGAAYHPAGLTVLLVYSDATALVVTDLPANFQLTSALNSLWQPGV